MSIGSRLEKLTSTAALALLVVVVCSACLPAYVGPEGARRVAVVGDSVTDWATVELYVSLSQSRAAVQGIGGINLANARPQLIAPAVATFPDVLVVELGINSARYGWTFADVADLRGALEDTRPVPCVVWVTPDSLDTSLFDRSAPGTLHERILTSNLWLEGLLPGSPNVHRADWGPIERAHPSWYASDGLHNSEEGILAYAAFVEQSVRTLCP